MFKDKRLRELLFGKHNFLNEHMKERGCTIIFLKIGEDDIERKIQYRTDDGLILALIKKIEKLEKNQIKK